MTEDVSAELARLQAEKSHLEAILRQHGITWGSSLSSAPPVLEDVTIADPVTPPSVVLSPVGKIALFQSKDKRHDLGRAGRKPPGIHITLIKDLT